MCTGARRVSVLPSPSCPFWQVLQVLYPGEILKSPTVAILTINVQLCSGIMLLSCEKRTNTMNIHEHPPVHLSTFGHLRSLFILTPSKDLPSGCQSQGVPPARRDARNVRGDGDRREAWQHGAIANLSKLIASPGQELSIPCKAKAMPRKETNMRKKNRAIVAKTHTKTSQKIRAFL